MSSLLHNVYYMLCGKRKTYPASSSSMRYLEVLRQVKILFTYIVAESEAFIWKLNLFMDVPPLVANF